MGDEKGDCKVVRSPPNLVDSYSSHVGGSAKWGEPSGPHIPQNKPSQHRQPQSSQRNARVTKLPSGSYKSTTINLSSGRRKIKGISEADSDEEECGCDGWARARQLEHDLIQLQRVHDDILKGLHSQLEQMKQKNRDMTFQLLMGPFASSVQVDSVPISPESDATSPKDRSKTGNRMSNPEVAAEGVAARSESDAASQKLNSNSDDTETASYTVKPRSEKVTDPRQARSLDVEILEEEAEELKKMLDEERAKNRYLLILSEDLKRQMREETGAWYPPPPNARRVSQGTPFRQNYESRKSYATEHSVNPNSIRLPQIQDRDLKDNQPASNLDQKHSSDAGIGSQRRKDTSKMFERNGGLTTLPAIIQTGESRQKATEIQDSSIHLKNEEDHSSTSMAKGPSKGKSRNKHLMKSQSMREAESHHSQNFGDRQKHACDNNERQVKRGGHHDNHGENHDEHRNKNGGHQDDHCYHQVKHGEHDKHGEVFHRRKHSGKKHPQERGPDIHQSPRNNRPESRGTSPRTRTISRGRGSDTEASSIERRRTGKFEGSNLNKKRTPKNDSNHASVQELSVSSSKQKETHSIEVPQLSEGSENVPASSSSSLGSLASSNGRTKNRGRSNRKGFKRNKKETQDSKENTREQ